MSEHKDLNGLWTGHYGYTASDERVPFTAWLDEANGHISGTTLEPNTITVFGPEELSADLTGYRSGSAVTFSKTYSEDSGIQQPPVRYDGNVNGAFTLITGLWFFDNLADHSGVFTLSRSSDGIEEVVERLATVDIRKTR